MITTGGYPVYGYPIGVLLLENTVPRIPGDIGNALSFQFPVRHKVVWGATGDRVLQGQGEGLLELFLEAGQELVREGVWGITTGCGFLAMFQRELAARLPVPVFTSSLMQIPMAHSMLCPGQKVGVISADARYLKEHHFKAVGAETVPMVVRGTETNDYIRKVLLEGGQELDAARMKEGVVGIAADMVQEAPEIGVFVLECSQFPPYSRAVRDATKRPVFDLNTLINWMYQTFQPTAYPETS